MIENKDCKVVASCGNYEPYAAGFADGKAIRADWVINNFINYLDDEIFELRHDMELIRKAAKQYKEEINGRM